MSLALARQVFDLFELRHDSAEGSLRNGRTGEVVLRASEYINVDRARSLWTARDDAFQASLPTVWLTPCGYASRAGPARGFGETTEAQAATLLAALARGFLGRLALRRLFRERFYSCEGEGGYLFFVDRVLGTSSWHKPRLAFPGDIPALEEQPCEGEGDLHLQLVSADALYSAVNDHMQGPFRHRSGLGRRATARSEHDVFLARNPRRLAAVSRPAQLDADRMQLGDGFEWLDGVAVREVLVDDYALMRSACEGGWSQVLAVLARHPTRPLLKLYALRCFAKGAVPVDPSGMLGCAAAAALRLVLAVLSEEDPSLATFALEALHNLLAVRAGRAEFLSAEHIASTGFLRQTALANFHKQRLGILHRCLVDDAMLCYARSSRLLQIPLADPHRGERSGGRAKRANGAGLRHRLACTSGAPSRAPASSLTCSRAASVWTASLATRPPRSCWASCRCPTCCAPCSAAARTRRSLSAA